MKQLKTFLTLNKKDVLKGFIIGLIILLIRNVFYRNILFKKPFLFVDNMINTLIAFGIIINIVKNKKFEFCKKYKHIYIMFIPIIRCLFIKNYIKCIKTDSKKLIFNKKKEDLL